MYSRKLSDKKGFTLVELLVVIAIIALLLAVLMPALSKVRAQAQCVVCKTRMKDIGNMFNVYMQDNGNKLPPSWASQAELAAGTSDAQKRWYQRLAHYYNLSTASNATFSQTKNSNSYSYQGFRCPTQEKWSKFAGNGAAQGMFGYNLWFFGSQNTTTSTNATQTSEWWQKPQAIKQPSELPLIGDICVDAYDGVGGIYKDPTTGGWAGPGNRLDYQYPSQMALKYGWYANLPLPMRVQKVNTSGPAPNHGNPNCNFLMADGHVDARNVCVPGKWPWITDRMGAQNRGTYFHPTRNPGEVVR